MKIALFLGAGASVEFGKPITSRMKQILQDKFTSYTLHDQLIQALVKVEYFQDIEYILSTIDQLFDFRKTLGHEFFIDMIKKNPGHQMIILPGSGSTSYETMMNELQQVRNTIQKEIFENYRWKHDADNKLNTIYGEILSYLKHYSDEIHVFTTNYDRAIEEYCSKPNNKMRCIDGFQNDQFSGRYHWMKGDYGYADKNTDGDDLYLYKLHGSLDWKKHGTYGIVRTGEESISDDENYEYNMLVYPTLSPKDGFEKEPYNKIREKFDEYMKNATVCIIIGYSFRDDHIDEIFRKMVDRGGKLVVVSPTATKNILKNLYKEEVEDNVENDKILKLLESHGNILSIDMPLEVATVREILKKIQAK